MDIQRLIEDAKETMLSEGSLRPIMHLELSVHYAIVEIDEISDKQSIPVQDGRIARIAWETGKKYPDEHLCAIGFYAESWRSEHPENEEYKIRPVRDPKKQEIIRIDTYDATTRKGTLWRFPVIRDHKRRVVDLGEIEGPTEGISWQIVSILQGYSDSQKPDEEVMKNMEAVIGDRIKLLTPSKRSELLEFGKQEGIPLDLIQRFL